MILVAPEKSEIMEDRKVEILEGVVMFDPK